MSIFIGRRPLKTSTIPYHLNQRLNSFIITTRCLASILNPCYLAGYHYRIILLSVNSLLSAIFYENAARENGGQAVNRFQDKCIKAAGPRHIRRKASFLQANSPWQIATILTISAAITCITIWSQSHNLICPYCILHVPSNVNTQFLPHILLGADSTECLSPSTIRRFLKINVFHEISL